MQSARLVVAHNGSFLTVSQTGMRVGEGPADRIDDDLLWYAPEAGFFTRRENQGARLEGLTAGGTRDARFIEIRGRRGLASAPARGGAVELDRTRRHAWETFALLSQEEAEALVRFRACRWREARTGQAASLGAGTFHGHIHDAGRRFDLFDNLEAILSAMRGHDDLALLSDGLSVVRYLRWDPLVYYAAYGRAHIATLAVSLASLFEVGAYEGEVCILGEDRDACLASVAEAYRDRVHFMHNPVSDVHGMQLARYRIADWAEIGRYGPVLYVDTDVCFIDEVDPMLRRIAGADRICVGTEHYPDQVTEPPSMLALSDAVGAALFRADGIFPGTCHGFNSGIIGFAHVEVARRAFGLVAGVMTAQMRHDPSTASPDQAVANYVAHQLGGFDTRSISGLILIGDAHTVHAPATPEPVPVLIHFWRVPGALREGCMRRALALSGIERDARRSQELRRFFPPAPPR